MQRYSGPLITAALIGLPTLVAAMTHPLSVGPMPTMPTRATGQPPYALFGRLTLVGPNLAYVASTCAGQGDDADIQAGAPITVTDESGAVLGVGSLGTGHQRRARDGDAPEACEFEFEVGGIREVEIYRIALERRGALQYSLAQMKERNWSIRLQLSS
jgi:hypothetical protein